MTNPPRKPNGPLFWIVAGILFVPPVILALLAMIRICTSGIPRW